MSTLTPKRTLSELKDLRSLTGTPDGAQRVAFTPTWAAARQFLRDKLSSLPNVSVKQDPAGNLWATLPGDSDRSLLLGGHLDSVPNGGWLDGCLGTLASLEVLRRIHSEYAGRPPVTVRDGITLADAARQHGVEMHRALEAKHELQIAAAYLELHIEQGPVLESM